MVFKLKWSWEALLEKSRILFTLFLLLGKTLCNGVLVRRRGRGRRPQMQFSLPLLRSTLPSLRKVWVVWEELLWKRDFILCLNSPYWNSANAHVWFYNIPAIFFHKCDLVSLFLRETKAGKAPYLSAPLSLPLFRLVYEWFPRPVFGATIFWVGEEIVWPCHKQLFDTELA